MPTNWFSLLKVVIVFFNFSYLQCYSLSRLKYHFRVFFKVILVFYVESLIFIVCAFTFFTFFIFLLFMIFFTFKLNMIFTMMMNDLCVYAYASWQTSYLFMISQTILISYPFQNISAYFFYVFCVFQPNQKLKTHLHFLVKFCANTIVDQFMKLPNTLLTN